MKSIDSLLQKVTSQVIKGEARYIAQLILEWPKIVGPHLSTITCPEKIVFQKTRLTAEKYQEGRLHLQVPHSGHAFELSMQQEFLRERINGFFGKNIVDKIIFKHGAKIFKNPEDIPVTVISKPPHISQDILKAINHIQDADLQQALLSMAKHLE